MAASENGVEHTEDRHGEGASERARQKQKIRNLRERTGKGTRETLGTRGRLMEGGGGAGRRTIEGRGERSGLRVSSERGKTKEPLGFLHFLILHVFIFRWVARPELHPGVQLELGDAVATNAAECQRQTVTPVRLAGGPRGERLRSLATHAAKAMRYLARSHACIHDEVAVGRKAEVASCPFLCLQLLFVLLPLPSPSSSASRCCCACLV
mmetsp:Transcript_10146/g.31135  ORF Transcript_10146/g.31135 Transcript_10146/m.31135 type:complete len:210 (+) Transcript_10146:231-860(+)